MCSVRWSRCPEAHARLSHHAEYRQLFQAKPEALRAEEDRAIQDYIVAWTQGLWDFVHARENATDPSTKRAQSFDERRHPRDERGRFADRALTRGRARGKGATPPSYAILLNL
jgi:hypothetical protein